jgi:predicted Zn finger-like uncharacterized protein
LKFLCDNCKAKYQIADEKVAGKTVRMKCRKCGHQIEVRAAVTETSVASQPPPPNAPRPAAVRPQGLATSLSAAKPRAPSSPGGALAGAFRSQVADPSSLRPSDIQNASDVGAISVTDEWYVAINGVPVGPVRISELRRKAAAGAVNEDSLCWQEGLEEWRPIRAIPELATLVREAMLGNRPSLVTPEPIAPRVTPPQRPAVSAPSPVAPQRSGTGTERPAPMRPSAPVARNNVVPIHGRGSSPSKEPSIDIDIAPVTSPLTGEGAAAARAPAPSFTPSPSPLMAPQPTPDPFTFNPVLPTPAPAPAAPQPAMQSGTYDPFAVPAAPGASVSTPQAPVVSPLSTSPSIPPGYMPVDQGRRGVPLWFWPILLLALGFGGMVAFLVFRQPAPQPVVINMPPTATTQAPPANNDVPPPPSSIEVVPEPSAAPTTKKTGGGGPRTAAAPTSTQRAADLSGLVGGSGGGAPTAGAGGSPGGQAGGGGTFDQAAVERVVANHRAGVKRTCWERVSGPDQKSSVNVVINANVAPNGTVSQTSSSGDDPVVAKCIESQVRTWTFPAPGENKQIQLPFKFVRQ